MTSRGEIRHGALHTIERIGNAVRRPMHRWTPAVHGLLKHLEGEHFQGVPRVLEVEEGYEILSYIEGDAGSRPWPDVLKTDSGLTQVARFLKSYHRAVENYVPPQGTEWYVHELKWRPGQLIRHGDLGPWNTIWRNGELKGVIDWDFVEPGQAITDVAQLAWHFVPLRGGDFWNETGFDDAPELRDRLNILCEAYGGFGPERVLKALFDLQELEISRISDLGTREVEPWSTYYKRGDLDAIRRERDWLRIEIGSLL